MEFMLIVLWNGRKFRLRVREIGFFARKKIMYEIKGRNKTIVVESNKPLLTHKNLEKWDATYKIITGDFHTPGFQKALLKSLNQALSGLDD